MENSEGTKDDHINGMIRKAVDPASTIGQKLTAIETLVNIGNVEYIEKLVAAGADVNNAGADVNVASEALYVAADNGNIELVELLTGKGADVNAAVKQKDTTLIQTVSRGNVACVNHLIQAGVDVNKTDKLKLVSPLSMAAKAGNKELVDLLIKSGAHVNWANCHGWTPLQRAAEKGHDKCVELLLKAGANVNAFTVYGDMALIISAEQGFTACVDLLLEAGADVNSSHSGGRLALSGATYSGNERIVKSIIDAGADVNLVANKRAYSPLMLAAEGGKVENVQLLLQAGARVNQVAFGGKSPLHTSVWKSSNNACSRVLIAAGADVNLADRDGNTCLITAVFHENFPVVKLLLLEGANINKINARGFNAIRYYLNKGPRHSNEPMVVLLYVAGEVINKNHIPETAEFLLEMFNPSRLGLKHICREAIRSHLLKLDPHAHLFGRVPQLGLPSSLTAYLLHYQTLDDIEEDE